MEARRCTKVVAKTSSPMVLRGTQSSRYCELRVESEKKRYKEVRGSRASFPRRRSRREKRTRRREERRWERKGVMKNSVRNM